MELLTNSMDTASDLSRAVPGCSGPELSSSFSESSNSFVIDSASEPDDDAYRIAQMKLHETPHELLHNSDVQRACVSRASSTPLHVQTWHASGIPAQVGLPRHSHANRTHDGIISEQCYSLSLSSKACIGHCLLIAAEY